MSSEAYVTSHVEHGINSIEFYHPQSNSLPGKILDELASEIHFAGTHADTRVIILKSGGEKTFCSGASFDELIAIANEEEGLKFFSGFANVINAMRRCPKFIIGRIQGKCVGGGVGLAAAVDYAIATTKAEVKLSELAVGIGPFVVGPAVENWERRPSAPWLLMHTAGAAPIGPNEKASLPNSMKIVPGWTNPFIN